MFYHKVRLHLSAGVLVSAIALAGCTPGADLPPLPPAQNLGYKLGPGDQIRTITYNEPQLSNTFTIGDNGMIAFPLIGTLQAGGRTATDLAAAITASLSEHKLLRDPSVSVEVLQYRPIFVLGEVNHPGQYPYQPGITMLSAAALAGGFTYRAVTSYAGDVRSEAHGGQAVEGKIRGDSFLEPGDVVTVYERYF